MSDSENEKWDKKDVYMKGNDSDFIEDEKEAVEIQKKRLNRMISKNLIPQNDEIHPCDSYILNKNIESKSIVKGETKLEIFNNFLDELENTSNKISIPSTIREIKSNDKKLSKSNKLKENSNLCENTSNIYTNNNISINKNELRRENGLKIMNEKNKQMIMKANKELAKGRGMYRKRKRKQGNARLMNKLKFQAKDKKRRNYVKEFTEKPIAYTGEATGIRRDLVRSIKFKD